MKRILLILLCYAHLSVLNAQDYSIKFDGIGASSSVSSVNVENLTQGITLKLNANEILHLSSFPTNLLFLDQTQTTEIQFYPNPMNLSTQMDFFIPEKCTAQIKLYDISGRMIAVTDNYLQKGSHSYEISGLGNGIYFIRINAHGFIYSGKILSVSSEKGIPKISYNKSLSLEEKPAILKNAKAEVFMKYNTGDRLIYTGLSGNNLTIVSDVPTESKTVTFTFLPCYDADGNNYPVVKIGDQWWMAENLKTTKFNDGLSISNVTDEIAWGNLITPGYCWYKNNVADKYTFGALYNWGTIKTEKLAPIGWHVPNNTEWATLTAFLGGNYFAGGKLKEVGTTNWTNPNLGAGNESGFRALPVGRCNSNGYFNNGGMRGTWWSSTDYDIDYAKIWEMDCNFNYISNSGEDKKCGFSVRCLVNENPQSIGIPILNTTRTSNISASTAISGGNITLDGGAPVTVRGVCWNTFINPTTANYKTTDGSGTGSFTSTMNGLTANTTYYVRAYAVNNHGTSYGIQENFVAISGGEAGTVIDIDSNTYHTVTIGTQVWMVENLKTTKYNDGTSIPNVTDNNAWSKLITPGYCWYLNDITYKNPYGALYNWYSVNTGKLAPKGWHIPTDQEWSTLINYLGGYSWVANLLQETGNSHWKDYNRLATNETGFTALPGGSRFGGFSGFPGEFTQLGYYGQWWSASDNGFSVTNSQFMQSQIDTYGTTKETGLSVRCLRD